MANWKWLRGFILGLAFCPLRVDHALAEVDWHFPVGLYYSDGFRDVVDFYEDEEGVDADFYLPVGVAFNPYLDFFMSDNVNLGAGAGIGPLMLVVGDVTFFNAPLDFFGRATLLPNGDVSPFVRLGMSFHAAFGDDVDSRTPGLLVGGGLEFLRSKVVSFGVEVLYDMAEVSFDGGTSCAYNGSTGQYRCFSGDRDIKPGGVRAGAFVSF